MDNGTIVEFARALRDVPRQGWDDHMIPDHDPNEVTGSDGRQVTDLVELTRVVAGLAQAVWVVMDPESEGVPDATTAHLWRDLADLLDSAGVKWTSGR